MVRCPVGLTPVVYLFPIVPVHPRPAHCCVSLPRPRTLSRSDPSLCCRLCRQALGPRATILRVFILVPGHQEGEGGVGGSKGGGRGGVWTRGGGGSSFLFFVLMHV